MLFGKIIFMIYQLGREIVVILYIYRSRDILIQFFDNQETESESQEMEIGVAGPIFTHKNKSLYGTMIFILYKMGGKVVVFLHIY